MSGRCFQLAVAICLSVWITVVFGRNIPYYDLDDLSMTEIRNILADLQVRKDC